MKKYTCTLILYLSCLLSAGLFATHNRSGEILYKRVPPFFSGINPVFTYSITVIKYFDDGPGIADRCVDTVYFGDGTKAIANRVNGTGGCGCNNCGEIILNNINYKVKKNIYTCIHTYSGSGTYIVSSTDPNRSAGSLNIPNSDEQPFVLNSEIVISNLTGSNASPVLTNPPFHLGLVQNCYRFQPAAFDPDGDSLSYELVPCIAVGYSNPATGSNGNFSISNTGLVTWCSPQLSGIYNIAIKIKEWRKKDCSSYVMNGFVIRDMEILIAGGPVPLFTAAPIANACVVAGATYSTLASATISPAQNFSLNVYGFTSYGNVAPMAMISPTAGTSSLTSNYSWQTNCAHVQFLPHQVVLAYRSPALTFYNAFNVKVVPPAPVIYNFSQDTSKVTLRWNRTLVCGSSVAGYDIYRKIGSNTWAPSGCETGGPLSSGFQKIGSTVQSDSSYVDNNFYSVANGSTGHYFVVTRMSDCSESYASAIKSFTLLVGLEKNKLDGEVSIYPNPFQNSIELDLPENVAGPVDVSVMSIDGRLVYHSVSNSGVGKISLLFTDLHRGLYLLKLNSANGTVSRKILRD